MQLMNAVEFLDTGERRRRSKALRLWLVSVSRGPKYNGIVLAGYPFSAGPGGRRDWSGACVKLSGSDLRHVGLALAAVLLTLVARAAGLGAAPASGESTVVRLVAREFLYEPRSVVAPPPGAIKFVLENRGAVEHDLVIEGSRRRKHAEILRILPGKTEEVTVMLTPGA
ncbi:MAG: hypothetical protein FJX78_00055 [Armatimonadetes bacterium]|nr:hypothetical protein [Armatimonadota bacterium]